MGKLTCQRCGATAEGETFADADELIDHAVGLIRGRPCSGKESDLTFDNKSIEPEISTNSDSDSTTKKSKRR